MDKDPSTSLIAAADASEPGFASYVQRYLVSMYGTSPVSTTGLAQQVIESGTRLLVPSVSFDQFLSMLPPVSREWIGQNPLPASAESISVVLVPMRARGAAIGSVGLFDRNRVQPLTEQDAVSLQSVADRAGTAIQNAQLYEDAIKRLERLSSLENVSRAIAASSDLEFTLKVILDQVSDKLEVDAADVLLFDETDRTLVVAASAGFLATSMPDYRLPPGVGLLGQAVANKRIEISNAIDGVAHAQRRSLFAREGIKAYGAVPLIIRGEVLGVLEVFHRSRLNPDQEWLSFLDAIGIVAAIAIDNAAMKERLKAANHATRSTGKETPAPEMTKVERQILVMLAEGLTNREIAARIHLSHNTIKFHVRQLLQKSGAINRTDLARKATQQGWL
jgi:GAF domain-containing protein/DNA-binding CsgD family transcriptional regulator